MKKLRRKTIEKFEIYFKHQIPNPSQELAIFIGNHWEDYKEWSKNKSN